MMSNTYSVAEKFRALWARWGLNARSDQWRLVLTQTRAIGNILPFIFHARQAEAWREKLNLMVPLIDHRHADAEASGAVVVVMVVGRALLVMRITWVRMVVIVMMVVTMFVHGGNDIAGVGRKETTVHADEHAEHEDDLEKNSHVDAARIGDRALGSRHFGPGPFLDMLSCRVFVGSCTLLVAKASCVRS